MITRFIFLNAVYQIANDIIHQFPWLDHQKK